MRVVACVGLLILCGGLAGCQSSGKKGTASPTSAIRAPAEAAPPRNDFTPTAASIPAPSVGGIIAGQVVDNFNRNPRATIRVVTPGSAEEGAPIYLPPVETDARGYFTIVNVKPGQPYQLIAQTNDGSVVKTGTTWVRPPDARVIIRVSEDFTPPSVPPAGSAAAPPVRVEAPVPAAAPPPPPPAQTESRPPVEMGAPIRGNAQGTPSAPIVTPRPESIVTTPGLRAREAPPVWIPGPRPPARPVPPPAGPPVAPGSGNPLAPLGATPVPSCQLVGDRLVNFALAGLDGQPWEYRRDRKGKLVLLDFWSTTCIPCQAAISHLVAWNNVYGPEGLEIIGLAYEREPTFHEQVRKVRAVANRKGINYRILMGSGTSCPVKTQFEVHYVPTLVLLDEEGRVLWRNRNTDQPLDGQLRELELMIKQRLLRR